MPVICLTLSRSTLLTLLSTLSQQQEEGFGWGVAGVVSRTDGDEFILPKIAFGSLDPQIMVADRHRMPFLLRVGDKWRYPVAWSEWIEILELPNDQPLGFVGFAADGSAVGWVRHKGESQWQPITEFHWPGSGMAFMTSNK